MTSSRIRSKQQSTYSVLCLPLWELCCCALALAMAFSASLNAMAGDEPSSGKPAPATATSAEHSVYLGWRLFQFNCAECHGADATGTQRAPNILPRVEEMSESKFVRTVLHRYSWVVSSSEAAGESGAREAFIEQVLQGKRGEVAMPAWENEPSVKASIVDLYGYLKARADGTLAPGRPAESK
jgi:cytochrome c553